MKFRRGTAILTAMASALIMTGCSSEEAKTNENGDTVITIGRQTAPNWRVPLKPTGKITIGKYR